MTKYGNTNCFEPVIITTMKKLWSKTLKLR